MIAGLVHAVVLADKGDLHWSGTKRIAVGAAGVIVTAIAFVLAVVVGRWGKAHPKSWRSAIASVAVLLLIIVAVSAAATAIVAAVNSRAGTGADDSGALSAQGSQ